MTLPTAVAVDTPDGRVVHVMTDGVLISMSMTEAQLFQVRLGRAIEVGAESPSGDGPDRPMTAKMNRKLHAQLAERGIRGSARHAALSRMVGRPITSASELSFDDAMTVIGLMEREYPDTYTPTEEPF